MSIILSVKIKDQDMFRNMVQETENYRWADIFLLWRTFMISMNGTASWDNWPAFLEKVEERNW